jgi:hypothetical protein
MSCIVLIILAGHPTILFFVYFFIVFLPMVPYVATAFFFVLKRLAVRCMCTGNFRYYTKLEPRRALPVPPPGPGPRSPLP